MATILLPTIKILFQSYPELLLSLAFFIFFYYWHKVHIKFHAPVNWPIVGMLPGLLANVSSVYDWSVNILDEIGCTMSFRGPWLMKMDLLFTSDPANVQHVFSVNFSNYPKGEEFSEIFEILGDGIFTADEESWRMQRMKAHRLISDRNFRSFAASFIKEKVENGLVPVLDHFAQRGEVMDLQDVFLRLTFDSTCYFVFGTDPHSLSFGFPTIPFARAMDDAMGALFLRHVIPPSFWKLMKWLRIGQERKLAKACVVVDEFISEKIEKKKLSRSSTEFSEGENPKAFDLLSSYIYEDLSNSDLTAKQPADYDKFLRDTAISFMLAGRDTTGAALTWFFWLLTKNPSVENKILEELKSIMLAEHTSTTTTTTNSNIPIIFDSEELNKLVYLHAALCEALRLYPPVPFELKKVVQSEVLPSSHKVQAGTKIIVNLYCMARNKGIWGKDCNEFKPERWITDKGRLKHEPSCKFMSFNSGPRTCLGKEVAFTQLKAVAAAMVWNFSVEVIEGHVVEPKLSIILHMKNGLKVRVKRRIN